MQWFIKMRALLLLLFIALSFSVTAQVTPPFPRTDSNTAVSDYNLFVPWTLDVPHGIDTATSHALKAGLDSLGLIYFDNVHHLLYIRDSIGSTHYWKAIPIGSPGAVTSFNTRTGAITLVAGDVTTALGGTPLLAANNLSDLTNIATARTNLGLSTLAATGQWSDVQNKPTTLAGYGITDPVVLTTGSYSNPSWITSLAFSKISGFGLQNGQLTTWNAGTGAVDFGGDATQDITAELHGHSLLFDSCNECTFLSKTINGTALLDVSDTETISSAFTASGNHSQIIVTPNGIQLFPQGTTGASPGYVWTLDDPTTGAGTWELSSSAYINIDNLDSVLSRGDTAHNKSFVLKDNSGNVRVNFNPGSNFYTFGNSQLYFNMTSSDSTIGIGAFNGIKIVANSFGAATTLHTQATSTILDNVYFGNTGNTSDTIAYESWVRANFASIGGSTNLNIGSGFRFAVPGTNNIKTIFATQGIVADSSSNSSAITLKGDTNYLVRYNDTTGSGTNNIATRTFVLAQGFITSSTNIYNTNGSLAANRTVTLNSHTLTFSGSNQTSIFNADGTMTLTTSSGTAVRSLQITNTVSGEGYNSVSIRSDIGSLNFELTNVLTNGFASVNYYTNSSDTGTLLGTSGYDYNNGNKYYIFDMRGPTKGASIEDGGTEIFWMDRTGRNLNVGLSGFSTPHAALHNNVDFNAYSSIYIRDSLFVGKLPTGTSSDAIVEWRSSDSAFFKVSTISLTSQISGVLPLANGGTNNATWTAGQIVYATSTTAFAGVTAPAHSGMKLTSTGVNSFAWEDTTASGGGAVSSVSNSDGTLTISPTTGAVVASIALGHANTWTATQTFSTIILSGTGGTNPEIVNLNTAAGFSQTYFYPSGGTNIQSALQVIPKGTGQTNNKSQIVVWGTDFIADASNYNYGRAINTGTTFDFQTANSGTGVLESIRFYVGATTTNGFQVQTDGNITFGTTTENGIATFAGNIAPEANNTRTNGTSSFRWSNSFSVLGNFSGIITNSNMLTATGTPTVVMHNADSTLSQFSLATLATKIPTQTGSVASADLTAQSATVSSVATVTPGANGTFRVGAYATITAISAGTLTITVTYTDETSTSRTATFFPMGLSSAGLTATGATAFSPADIRAKSGSAITVVSTFSGVSITYDIGATITQLR